MIIRLLDKLDLISYNKKLNYHLAAAEKDYMLCLVMKIISNSNLNSKLVFKGGTAIHHCYLQQLRFSEDVDFTSVDKNITLQNIKNVFLGYDFFEIKKEYVSKATIKIERLKYTGPLFQTNSLKVEIDRVQNVLLKPRRLQYNNVWNLDFQVNVMDEREIYAEKIRAASDRSRYRDFYDLYWLFKKFNFDENNIVDIIKRKEIRRTISKDRILSNWQVAKQQQEKVASQIFCTEEVSESNIEKLINNFQFNEIKKNRMSFHEY